MKLVVRKVEVLPLTLFIWCFLWVPSLEPKNWKLLTTFDLIEKSNKKVKLSFNRKRLTRLCPVKIVLKCPYKKQMICDGHSGFFHFEKPRSNRLTLVRAWAWSFSYEPTIDWQLDIDWLFNFHASLQVNAPPGIKAWAILHQELPSDRKWKFWLAKDEGFSVCWIFQ